MREQERRRRIHEEQIQRIAQQIKDALGSTLGYFKDKPIHEQSIRSVKDMIMSQFMAIYEMSDREKQHIQFDVNRDPMDIHSLLITPGNLFTLLVMQGDYVPLFYVENSKVWTTERGEYRIDANGKAWFMPKPVAEHITIDISIKADGSNIAGPSEQES